MSARNFPARILHIAYSGAGGTGEVAVELARHTDRRFQSAVCFFGIEPVWSSFQQRLDAAGVEWAYVPLRGRLGSLWRLVRQAARLRPDLVVAHGATNGLALPWLRMVRPGLKTVAIFHGPPLQAQTASGILYWLPAVFAAHCVVSVGPHLARVLRENLHRDSLVIRNGVEPAGMTKEPAEGELLMVATLSPSKDHKTLLEAAALLARRRNHFRLVLAGDGLLRPELERRTRELGLAERVEFLGSVSPEERRRWLSRATIFVYATHEEGGCPPQAVMEAMAAGLPIVASRVPGMTEGLEDRRTALLVPPRNPAALADAVATLLNCPEEAARLGRAAQEVARRGYSLAACIRSYEDLFDSLLRSDQGARWEKVRPSRPDILFVTTTGMGVRYLLRDKIEALAAVGYRVRALCGRDAYAAGLAAEGLPLDTIKMFRFFHPLADLRSLASLARYLFRERPRIVHTSTQKAGLLGPLAARMVGIPCVHTVAGLLFHDRSGFRRNLIFRAAERLTASFANYLLFQSREDLERIQALGWKAPDRLLYLGNGINLARFDPDVHRRQRRKVRAELGYGDEHFVVGIVARLLWTKGLGEFLEAAARLRSYSALRFLVVGPPEKNHWGAVPEAVLRRAAEKGNLRFLGERQDLPELYAAMDLFVLPSYREGVPRALLEASAMELPVIASDIRGCREVVENGRTGWLVPVRDVPALVERILECWRHPGQARQLGRAGRTRAARYFDEREVQQRLVRLYGKLLGQPSQVVIVPPGRDGVRSESAIPSPECAIGDRQSAIR